MKKFIASLLVIISVIAAIPALSACSSGPYIKYTLYTADGTAVETYKVSPDPTEDEVEAIGAEDGSYFVVRGYSGRPETIVIPETYGGIPVTAIAQQAFENARYLLSVTIGDNVKTMGLGCFMYCTSLKDVTLSSSLTKIPQSAFAYCMSLKSIAIPEGVTTIGSLAFIMCEDLTSVTLPGSLITISSYAFQGCSAIEYLVIPQNVQSIGASAFLSCSTITSLAIPDSVTYIGYAAFQNCSSVETLDLGSSVTYIGAYAFCYCLSLTSVTIPSDVTYIGENAFCYAPLTNVYMDNCFSDGTEKMCYLYTVDLSSITNSDGETTELAAGSDEAKAYLYTTYNYFTDYNGESSITEYSGYIPKGAFEDSEYMATLLTSTLAGNENLGSSADITVYWYFVSA